MTNNDFSNAFDTLLSSYSYPTPLGQESSASSIVLDEYEKSLFLTQAQEELVISLYSGKNTSGDTFEGTEELRRYLSSLVKDKELTPITNSSGLPLGMGSNSKFFTLPKEVWFITYESVTVDNSKSIAVYPVKQDEYHRLKNNPFRGANNRRALRFDLSEGNIEIVSKYSVSKYYIRFISKITPIILEDLPDGLTIEGESKETKCNLHESLHNKILELAVYKAVQSKGLIKNNNS